MMIFSTKTATYIFCLVGLILGVLGDTNREQDDQECNPSKVEFGMCKANETCIVLGEKAVCKCKHDFARSDSGVCEPVPNQPSPSPAPNTAESSDAGGFGFKLILWLLIPVLLAVGIAGIVYTGRQKMWLSRLYRMRIRSYNNVMVSSQDEDDPPIA